MAIKKEATDMTVEQKLKSLYELQTMLTEIDKIKTLRGELPLEVQDLEDEIEGLKARSTRYDGEIKELESGIAAKKNDIATAQASIERYKAQLDEVRNNREYDTLSKEIEFQTLEVELLNKRIREAQQSIDEKKAETAHAQQLLTERSADLDVKKSELDEIIAETKAEEEKLREKAKAIEVTLSAVSARAPVTVWASSTYNAMPAAAVSTRYRPSGNSTSACARKSSSASIAAAS